MAPLGRRGTNKSAKEVLDEIGEKIQKEAYQEAQRHNNNELKGDLSKVKFSDNTPNTETDPCLLNHIYHTNVTSGKGREDPCFGRVQDRFSDERRSQCTSNRIRGTQNDVVGACAPYRRLHVCDENLEVINPENITSTDNLLMDVLLAAKYEGQSLMEKYPYSEHHNTQSICPMLARSFADIGDIIRGKDLYLGNSKEKDYLQDKLKKYFQKIYDNLKDSTLQDKYKDEKDRNYYKLREDWWALNRKDVWNSMTCEVPGNAYYFRQTCSNDKTGNIGQCRCVSGDPPTYFDYVPQYLRWFEEWSEEFCRIKNIKLQNAITNCRGENENGEEIYCSRNGYDCIKTIRSMEEYSVNRECAKCIFACDPYVKWIDNKKKEFEKQKKKCENEIYRNKKLSQSSPKNYNNMYETDFYEKLNKEYPNMSDFLKLLNNETQCKNLQDYEETKVDFNNTNDTFSHTEYCEPCPWCGLEQQKDGNWKRLERGDPHCPKKAPYTPPAGVTPTEIDVLQKDEKGKDILQKLHFFCNDNKSRIKREKWKCYYQKDNDKCVLENSTELGVEKKIKDYDNFLMFWVAHMLKDSIEWRSKLSKCLKNDKKKCINKCNTYCKCYEKWVQEKKKEWLQIKRHFDKQHDIEDHLKFYILEKVLEEEFFTDITKAYGDPNEIKRIKTFLENNSLQIKEKTIHAEDIIQKLLDHELKEAKQCLETHKKDPCENTSGGRSQKPDDHSESEDEEEEEPEGAPGENPCGGKVGGGKITSVKSVAHHSRDVAHKEMKKNSHSAGKNVLKANAKDGTYSKGGEGKNLDATYCNIDKIHSNSTHRSQDPCQGKNTERFKIGIPWSYGENGKEKTHPKIYMPPRREHMCTSNLEFLEENNEPLDGRGKGGMDIVNHSFLGDVLLSANFEANNIKDVYIKNNDKKDLSDPNDQETVCQAMKYSFADIGDIIRGRDMWVQNKDFEELQKKLKTIFGYIHTSIKEKGNDKYNTDGPDYKLLRSDWWEANRKDVWRAMKCALSSGTKCSSLPVEDYIPQRLRWMTEWVEWYCKMQSQEYDKLVGKCQDCKEKNANCFNNSSECGTCKPACEGYNKEIKKWQEQWKKIKDKYQMLYLYAQTGAHGIHPKDNDQQVVQFFKKLQEANGDTTPGVNTSPYSTAEGYIHQEMGPNVGCKGQEVFCNSDGKNTKYAFMDPPHGYGEACKCDTRDKKSEPPPKKEEPACEIVKKLFENEASKDYTDWCTQKYSGKNSYRSWDCRQSTFKKEHQGACMPPRRKYLYIHKLKNLNSDKTSTDIELRKAFIECAAIETFFAWHKYKEVKKKEKEEKKKEKTTYGGYIFSVEEEDTLFGEEYNPQKQLESGKIPDEFKHEMFYTFGDYRDLCLGKDIGSDMDEVNEKITAFFPQKVEKIEYEKRKQFWKRYEKDIWNGMICALINDLREDIKTQIKNKYLYEHLKKPNDHTHSLEEFSSRPQFFRWLEEWAREFCRKRKDKLEKIEKECRGDYEGHKYCSADGYDCKISELKHNNIYANLNCPGCHEHCRKYKEWIENKEEEFDKHKNIYQKQYEKIISRSNNEYHELFHNYIKENSYSSVAKFLESPNHGKYCQGNSDSKKNTDFNNLDNTFGPSEYCKTCPLNGVTCNNRGLCTPKTENEKNSTKGKSIEISLLLNDGATDDTDQQLLETCKKYGLYKDLKNQKWKCQHMDKILKCELQNHVNSRYARNNIPIKVLFERWLRDFLEGYNKSKEKITRCTVNVNSCIEGCKGKCVCVEKWLKIKEKEWENIKNYYKNHPQYTYSLPHWVRSFFNQGPFIEDVNKAKKIVESEEEQKKLWGCTGETECKNEQEEKEHADFITNLIKKLQEKIESCQTKHDPKQSQTCVQPPPSDGDDENTPTDNDAQKPAFCPAEDTTTKEKEEESEVQPEPTEESNGPTDPGELQEEEEEGEASQAQDDNKTEERADENEASVPEQTSEEDRAPPPATPPKEKTQSKKRPKPKITLKEYKLNDVLLPSAFPLSVGIAFAALSYFVLKKKTKSTIDLLRVIDIPKGDYGIPTLKSSNRYIPYGTNRYKGKTYIYMEGDSGDEKYIGDISSSDITSSESEYEELDINDIYPYKSPKYKTLIEVVLEPSKRDTMNTQSDIPLNDKLDSNKLTDEEWNQLKQDFISNILQNPQKHLPQNNISANIQMDIHPDVSMLHDSMEEKPFITSIHDRNLLNGEDVSYNLNLDDHQNITFSTNHDNITPKNNQNNLYTGIDLINDSINGNHNVDIYDELLKRKENELFGTNHTKHTTTNIVAKQTLNDPILNQINLFHKWLDRHKNMCEQWDKNKKEELLDKLKKAWEQDYNNNSGDIHTSDNNIVNNVNHVFNTDVSIQIDMDYPKPINQFTNMYTNSDNSTMDNILNDMEKHREPYFYDIYEDDITYFDIDDEKKPMGDIYGDHNNVNSNNMDVPTKMHIEMNIVNNKKEIFEEEYPISDIWNI
ncbi:erythrocyte membrane protein 1, PfEMP1, putative [Plasmodium sp. gorilla clade G1]|nr:erythrocyte membrane protein 1, PfEMP1, putative [Plasmodium sp. gorilla clade G1]